MTSDEYRAALARLGMTQGEGAALVGVDARTSRRWALGERDIPEPVARFLLYLIATGKTGAQALRKLERAGAVD